MISESCLSCVPKYVTPSFLPLAPFFKPAAVISNLCLNNKLPIPSS